MTDVIRYNIRWYLLNYNIMVKYFKHNYLFPNIFVCDVISFFYRIEMYLHEKKNIIRITP